MDSMDLALISYNPSNLTKTIRRDLIKLIDKMIIMEMDREEAKEEILKVLQDL